MQHSSENSFYLTVKPASVNKSTQEWQSMWFKCQRLSGRLQTLHISHLLVRLEDVLGGDRADGCAQRSDHSVGHLGAHAGGVAVQDAEVALVTLHHQLQRAPLRVHAADVFCPLLTPPALHLQRHTKQQVGYSGRLEALIRLRG